MQQATEWHSLPSYNQLLKTRRERSRHLIVKQAIGEMLLSVNFQQYPVFKQIITQFRVASDIDIMTPILQVFINLGPNIGSEMIFLSLVSV